MRVLESLGSYEHSKLGKIVGIINRQFSLTGTSHEYSTFS